MLKPSHKRGRKLEDVPMYNVPMYQVPMLRCGEVTLAMASKASLIRCYAQRPLDDVRMSISSEYFRYTKNGIDAVVLVFNYFFKTDKPASFCISIIWKFVVKTVQVFLTQGCSTNLTSASDAACPPSQLLLYYLHAVFCICF